MKLKHRIRLNLLDFLKTGKFDYIKLGQSKSWILANFPDPDDLEIVPELYNSDIWCYGDFEFHFDANELILIHSEWMQSLEGGDSLELERWIFSAPDKLSLSFVLEQLNIERINFSVEHPTFGALDSVKVTILNSGVKLGFSPVENQREGDITPLKDEARNDSNKFRCDGFNLSRG